MILSKKIKILTYFVLALLIFHHPSYASDTFNPDILKKLRLSKICPKLTKNWDYNSKENAHCYVVYLEKKYEYYKNLTKSSEHYDKHKLDKYTNTRFLASKYRTGKGVKRNFKKSIKLYEEVMRWSEENTEWVNEPDYRSFLSQETIAGMLGWMYKAYPEVRNYQKALEYFTFAADNNRPYAMNNLGIMYLRGEGVKPNPKKAFKLFKQSASYGNHWAHENIADYYLLGVGGIKKNYAKTIMHLKLSQIEVNSSGNFAALEVLFEKKRLPKNKDEFYSWLIENLKTNKQSLSYVVNIANFSMNNWSNYTAAYKWFYICNQFPDEMDYSVGGETEKDKCKLSLTNLEADFLSIAQIKKAKLDADNWKKEFWN